MIYTRYIDQAWPGVSDTDHSRHGRGLISLQHFEKNDIIIDYHGKIIRAVPFEIYTQNEDVNSEYCIETFHANKRIIDATSENCVIHNKRKCLGRLANHARVRNKNDCNLKIVDVKLTITNVTADSYVMLVATRNIAPFEELRFDYGDPVAYQLFDDN
jgi:hypothetical protein